VDFLIVGEAVVAIHRIVLLDGRAMIATYRVVYKYRDTSAVDVARRFRTLSVTPVCTVLLH
jgi:hypothetical protein